MRRPKSRWAKLGFSNPLFPDVRPYPWPPLDAVAIPTGRHGALVYVIAPLGNAGLVKIGTTTNLGVRLKALQTGSPRELRVLATCPGGRDLEAALHDKFAAFRRLGEWFGLPEPEGVFLVGIVNAHKDAAARLRRQAVRSGRAG